MPAPAQAGALVNETDIADESWGDLTGGGQEDPNATGERWGDLTGGGQEDPNATGERWGDLTGGGQEDPNATGERWDDLTRGGQDDPDAVDERWGDLIGGAQDDPDAVDERWDDLVDGAQENPYAAAAGGGMAAGEATGAGGGLTAGADGGITSSGGSAAVDEVRLTVWVQGRVQGVGFRWWVRWNALELGLAGAAENLVDGRVKVIAEGSKGSCAALLERLEGADAPGRVVQVTFRWDHARGGIVGFTEL